MDITYCLATTQSRELKLLGDGKDPLLKLYLRPAGFGKDDVNMPFFLQGIFALLMLSVK
ncbi:hypothetical protein NLX69_22125 [Rossellomorea sp. BNER]|nr:hypothetical protein [Rossellomorea sp. BNER]